jgi:hypothetical protein
VVWILLGGVLLPPLFLRGRGTYVCPWRYWLALTGLAPRIGGAV